MREPDSGIFLPFLVSKQPAAIFGKGALPKAVFLELVTMSVDRQVSSVKIHATVLAEAVGCYRKMINKALTELQERKHVRWYKVNKRNQYQHRNQVTLLFTDEVLKELRVLGTQHQLPFPTWLQQDFDDTSDVDFTVLLK